MDYSKWEDLAKKLENQATLIDVKVSNQQASMDRLVSHIEALEPKCKHLGKIAKNLKLQGLKDVSAELDKNQDSIWNALLDFQVKVNEASLYHVEALRLCSEIFKVLLPESQEPLQVDSDVSDEDKERAKEIMTEQFMGKNPTDWAMEQVAKGNVTQEQEEQMKRYDHIL